MSLVNGVGMLLALYSGLLYHRHTPHRTACEYFSMFGLSGVLVWLLLIQKGHVKLNDVGVSAMIASVSMFAAPLVALLHILQRHFSAVAASNTAAAAAQKKSSIWCPREGLSLTMIGISCCVSGGWLLYGRVIGDAFLSVPNGLGLLMSGLQLAVWSFARPDSQVFSGLKRAGEPSSTSSSLSASQTNTSKDPFLKANSVAPFIELKRF